MDLKLSGKRALITGGSKGIGRAIALHRNAEPDWRTSEHTRTKIQRNRERAVRNCHWRFDNGAANKLKPGAVASAEEIVEHCRARMASYKKPRFVEFAPSLPRTPIGMIDYRALDAAYGGGNYPGGALRGS